MFTSVLAIIVGFHVWAIEGHFGHNGNIFTLQQQETKVVPNFKDDKIRELKDQGFLCTREARFTKCVRLIHPSQLPITSVQPRRKKISFGPEGIREIVADGETVFKVKVEQTVIIDGQTYEGVLYTQLPTVLKAEVGVDSTSSIYFLVEENFITELQEDIDKQDRFNWTYYLMGVEYSPLPY